MEQARLDIKGKTALITGSSAGLGYAMAKGLARAGCNVVLHGIEPVETVREQSDALRREHGVAASYLQADLALVEDVGAVTLEALMDQDPAAAATPLSTLGDALRRMHTTRGSHYGKLAAIARGEAPQARRTEDIIEDARAREREIRLGAEDYADEILNTLEVNLSKFIAAVQRGRERLQGKDEPAEVA